MKFNLLYNILFLISFFQVFCQSGEIGGKLLIATEEERNSLPSKIYAILKHENIKDSIQIDENFNFKFENLRSGKYYVSFSVRNYPINRSYIFNLKENEKINQDIELKPICIFQNSKEKTNCPVCKKDDKVIPIAYGLRVSIVPKGEKENSKTKNKVHEGGCVVSDCQPNWYCERDETKF
jgi:hypothetical protein